MTESHLLGNEFSGDAAFDAHGLPDTLRHLLRGRQVFLNPSEIDYREMSKEFEQANTAGLPLYPIRHPQPAETMAPESLTALEAQYSEAMNRMLKTTAWVMAEFGIPGRVRMFVPQTWGYLAQTLGRLSGRVHPASLPQPVHYTLLVQPAPLTRRKGSALLERGLFVARDEAVLIGADDPVMLVRLIESAIGASFFQAHPVPATSLDAETALQPGAILFDVPLDDRARPIPFTPGAESASSHKSRGLVILPQTKI